MTTSIASILECFEQDLPELAPCTLGYTSVEPSSDTTARAEPPRVLLCKTGKALREEAERFLCLPSTQTSTLAVQPLGPIVEQINLHNEGGLVMASTLYLIKPILHMLQLRYGGKMFTISSEDTAKKEMVKTGESATRVDLIFRSVKDGRVILIIEYKRQQQILYKQFERTLLPSNASERQITNKIAEAANATHHTVLDDNALSYTKQVSKYAEQQDCKHVALANWDHLLLFEFNKLNYPLYTAGPTAELTWISEKRSQGEFITQDKMRMSLMGFAFLAFEEYVLSVLPG